LNLYIKLSNVANNVFFHCFVSVLLIAVGPYTMSTTDHIGHKA